MPKRIDFDRLTFDFKRFLVREGGKATQSSATAALNISQPTFSRLIDRMRGDLLVIGKGRSACYALKKGIPEIGLVIPLFEVGESGEVSHLADLHSLEPQGFYMEGKKEGVVSRFFPDLPYFMEDLCPAGFLGRLIPKKYPDLKGPEDIRYWNTVHCLRYFTRYGSDLIGNLIVGMPATERYLQQIDQPINAVPKDKRAQEYPRLAEKVLQEGPAGSSAGGEQPKFLAFRRDSRKTPVMVKFSPPLDTPAGKRWSDLLLCEHLAHLMLNQYQMTSLKSEVIWGRNQIFLETERFDRVGSAGRCGVVSLFALSMEYTGILGSWSDMALGLVDRKIIDTTLLKKIRWLDLFGDFIGNTDKHPSNLSFFTQSLQGVDGLTPVYDMLPMLYRPEHGQIVDRSYSPPIRHPIENELWDNARKAARDFWRLVEKDRNISRSFKKIAAGHVKKIGL